MSSSIDPKTKALNAIKTKVFNPKLGEMEESPSHQVYLNTPHVLTLSRTDTFQDEYGRPVVRNFLHGITNCAYRRDLRKHLAEVIQGWTPEKGQVNWEFIMEVIDWM